MKKKQKDDILGEEQSNLPINEGTLHRAEFRRTHELIIRSPRRMSKREVQFQEGILLPAADSKR